mgnify:FL=1
MKALKRIMNFLIKNGMSKLKKLLLSLLLLPLIVFGQKETIIHLTTDQYPTETRWVLYADSLYGTIIDEVSYGHYTSGFTTHHDTTYIPDTINQITFIIWDSYGDGMSGSYVVEVCTDTIIENYSPSFSYGFYHNRTVPQCMPQPPPNCIPTLVNINLDQFQSETTWEINDTAGVVLASGGPYTNAPDYEPQMIPVCLPVGNLTFTIYDSYGDGLAGSLWGGQDGSYYLIQCGDTLVDGSVANFGTDSTHAFVSDTCIPPPLVPGCMDENYIEYDPLATVDDSSCTVLKIYGCTDSTMYNYNPLANWMDYVDSCNYTLVLHDLVGNGWIGSKLEIYQDDTTFYTMTSGFNQTFTIQLQAPEIVKVKFFVTQQASATALECGFTLFNPMGDTIISVVPPFMIPFHVYSGITYCGTECIEEVSGCLDSLAYNYNSIANISDGSCYFNPGCMYSAYLEWHQDTTIGNITDYHNQDSCNTPAVFGCMDIAAFNYDSSANVDNGGCIPVITGCMQPLAFNYNVNANTADTCIPIIYGCMSQIALNYDSLANTDDGSCMSVVYGCTDTLMWNYAPLANIDDSSCVPYIYGCTDATMWNYNSSANTDNGTCIAYLYGCTDSTMYNYDPFVNTDNGTCVPYIYGCTNSSSLNYCDTCNIDDGSCIPTLYGCTDSTMFNYDPLANTDNGTCIPIVLGCTNPTALNYNIQANTDDFSCILPIYGCMDSLAFNYNLLANVDNGSCIPIILGCTDPIALNYCDSCNVDDFSCILPIYGCMDSTMWNYNSLANVDNNTCIPYIYGCTDGSANNYNPLANTEDGSCYYLPGCTNPVFLQFWTQGYIADYDNGSCTDSVVYGCMDATMFNYNPLVNTLDNSCCYISGCTDSTALNYNSMACYNDNSCIAVVWGCMDNSAYNYNIQANMNDSSSCLYDAGCVGGPGIPYWLNDPCYAWVIDVDSYCCDIDWDTDCQSMYNYCEEGWTGPTGFDDLTNKIIVYPNPTTGIIRTSKPLDITIYNALGEVIFDGKNVNYINLSNQSNGIYNIIVNFDNRKFTQKLIKR